METRDIRFWSQNLFKCVSFGFKIKKNICKFLGVNCKSYNKSDVFPGRLYLSTTHPKQFSHESDY